MSEAIKKFKEILDGVETVAVCVGTAHNTQKLIAATLLHRTFEHLGKRSVFELPSTAKTTPSDPPSLAIDRVTLGVDEKTKQFLTELCGSWETKNPHEHLVIRLNTHEAPVAELKYEKEEIEEAEEVVSTTYRKDYIEQKLLGIALWQKSLRKPAADFEAIFEKLGEVRKKYEDIKEDLIFEAEVFYADNENLEKNIREMFLNLEEENINEELSKKISDLRRARDEESGKKLLEEINELNKRKEDIKNNRLRK